MCERKTSVLLIYLGSMYNVKVEEARYPIELSGVNQRRT